MKISEENWDNFMLLNGMLATATDISFQDYVEVLSTASEELGSLGKIFARIRSLAIRWHVDTQMLLQRLLVTIRVKRVSDFFMRLARTLKTGTSLIDFLRMESSTHQLSEQRAVERAEERYRLLTDAYSSLLSSLFFLFITLMITSVVFGFGNPNNIILTLICFPAACAIVMLLARRVLPPYEVIRPRARIVIRYRILTTILIIVAMILPFVIFLLNLPPEVTFLTLIPLGLIAFIAYNSGRKVINIINHIDEELPLFISYLADVTASTGSIIESISVLTAGRWRWFMRPLRRLKVQLDMGANFERCWRLFRLELLSRLAWNSLGLFLVGVRTGLDPNRFSEVLIRAIDLKIHARRIRSAVAGYARGLIVPIHCAFVGVTLMLMLILDAFGKLTEAAAGVTNFVPLPFFTTPVTMMTAFIFIITFTASIIFIIMNSLFMGLLEGGSPFPTLRSLAYLLLATGIVGFLTTIGVKYLVQIMGVFGGG
jgi:archaellum biogenesis protein FlaJ (TadC family)